MNTVARGTAADPVADALVQLAARIGAGVVLDVGGGSGTRAVPLARLGCTVVVVDSSIDALAILGRRAADAGVADRVTGLQADAVALSTVVSPGTADLVLCHHLLETVDDPSAVVAGIAAALKAGGLASVLVAGRFAAVLAHAAAGRFVNASAILADPDGRFGPDDPLARRFDITGLQSLLTRGGLEVEAATGIGVVSHLLSSGSRSGVARQDAERPSGGPDVEPRLAQLEAQLAGHHPLREIATDLHVVARSTVR